MKNFNLKNIKTKHFLFALLAVVFLVSCSNGGGDFGEVLTAILKTPVSEMSLIDLIIILVLVNMFTN